MNYKTKEDILKDNPELILTSYGDFVLRKKLVSDYEIIDSHTHIYLGTRMLDSTYETQTPEEINMTSSFFDHSFFSRNIRKFDLNEEFFKRHPQKMFSFAGVGYLADMLSSIEGMMRSSREATIRRISRDMQDASVAASVVLPLANQENMEGLERYFEEVSGHKNLIPFSSVHPLDKEADLRIKYSVSQGAKGFKLHPAFWKIAIDDEHMITLIKKIANTGLPIVSCSGIAFPARLLKSKFLPPALAGGAAYQMIRQFRKVVKLFPETAFILAHGGGGLNNEVINLMEECDNIYTDISSQPAKNLKTMVDRLGDRRIFYGSDYPVWNQAFSLLTVLKAVKSEESRKKIFGENIKRVLEPGR